MAKKLKITETVLRDAHQSLLATRMPLSDMLPILPELDKIGFYSLECWGGATFDACLRFLDEDPWERLRTLRKECPNTKLQMLFRGQNMLGYRHYADDVLEYFVQKSVANGIDIIRIFDALNDIKNLETAVKAAKKEGAHAQIAMSYTTGPVFDNKYYVDYAKKIEAIGADSICIKDMAALLTPYKCESLIKDLKKAVNIPIQLHTHATAGLSSMCIMKAVENGCDVVDTAMSPLADGTSHSPTESIVAAFQGTKYDTGLDLAALANIREYFMGLRQKYLDSGLIDPKMLATDASALLYQVPGGMLSNLLSQLKQAGKEDKLLLVIFIVTCALTNFMSNTATTALMIPIAVSLANNLGADPRAVVIATVIAGSCAYATPIGMPANTMVVGLGGYKFKDYVKSGLPLILVSFVICMILLPVSFRFYSLFHL